MDKQRPHIVLIMADHLRRDCLSCYGDINVDTPHLDALSRESIIFDQAYCSSPLCTPTRTSMYTGKWPHTNGAIVNGGFEREVPHSVAGPEHRTLYEQLDDGGYAITHVGVDHCRTDPPLTTRVPDAHFITLADWHGFLKSEGVDLASVTTNLIAEHRRPTPNYDEGQVKVKHFGSPQAIARFPLPADQYLDGYWARQATEVIAELDPNQPQFLEFLFWAPHSPFYVPDPYFGMYAPESIELPETVGRWCEGQPASLLLQTPGALGALLSREQWREPWAAYLALVTMVDDCIGRVVDALKACGIWDDALVLSLQDHGDNLGCHALAQKHCAYEESCHVPLLIKPPGGGDGRRSELVGHIDFAQTVCDYAQLDPPNGVQGRSLRPVIETTGGEWRDALFIEYNGDHGRSTPIRAVAANVKGSVFKYIYNQGDRDELYDLTADPLEMKSLSGSTSHRGVRDQLRARLSRWMRETGDFLDPQLP
jgi:arylsulfatase A-like enzyme